MDSELKKECMVCGRLVEQSQGIHLLQHFICNECEQEIVTTGTEDEHYRFFVKRLHLLWQDLSMERVIP